MLDISAGTSSLPDDAQGVDYGSFPPTLARFAARTPPDGGRDARCRTLRGEDSPRWGERCAVSHASRRGLPPEGERRAVWHPSRQASKLGEVRFSLLEVGVLPFLRFLGEVVEQGCVAGQVEKSELAVAIRVEGRLEAPQRQRRVLEHFAAPLQGFLLEVGEGNDGIDETHVKGFPGVVLAAEEPDFPGLLLTHDAGQV